MGSKWGTVGIICEECGAFGEEDNVFEEGIDEPNETSSIIEE